MGKVMMSGVAPNMKAPISGILASELAVGSVVKLMEDGVATEYLVVNQGKPSGSSLYDDSCDGLWLLRNDIKVKRQWHSSKSEIYKDSDINSYLNGTFFNLFDTDTQSIIKQVKIPYVNGTAKSEVASGDNGLSSKIFLLSGYEVGFTQSINSNFPIDGAKLDFFISGNASTANAKRIAKLNGGATTWWLRSPNSTSYAWSVETSGGCNGAYCTTSFGIRPALVLPSNALFDTNTLILKGVA